MSRALPILLLAAGCGSDFHLGDTDEEVTDPVEVDESFTQVAYARLDVLFVVDGTGSMAQEQSGIAAAAGTFVAALDELGLAWQLGVVRMDAADEGALLGRPWILTPECEDPATTLASALQVGTSSAPPSAGLDVAAMAIEDASGQNLGFRRPDAALHVIFVSDGDDESGAYLGDDPVSAFEQLLKDEADRSGHVARASAIVDDGSASCDGGGFDTLPGTRFLDVAAATGGRVASICTTDFTEVAQATADVAVEGATVFPLQAVPAEGSVLVTVDGARVNAGWSVDYAAPALVFDEPPALDASIGVHYELATTSG